MEKSFLLQVFLILIFLFVFFTAMFESSTNIVFGNEISTENSNRYAVDLNGDGKSNIFDLLQILRQLSGKISPAPSSDLDGNGRIDLFDLLKLLGYLSLPRSPGNARLCIKVKDSEQVDSIAGLQLATSLVTGPVNGAILDVSDLGSMRVINNFIMDSTKNNLGELYWEKSLEVIGGQKVFAAIFKLHSHWIWDYVTFAGISQKFNVESGNIYQVEISYFDIPFVIIPRIEKLSEKEQYVVWDSLPSAKNYYVSENIDSVKYVRHEAVRNTRIPVSEPGAETLYYTFFPVDYTGMVGLSTYYIYKPKENIFERFE